jgi:hypothetical protein
MNKNDDIGGNHPALEVENKTELDQTRSDTTAREWL